MRMSFCLTGEIYQFSYKAKSFEAGMQWNKCQVYGKNVKRLKISDFQPEICAMHKGMILFVHRRFVAGRELHGKQQKSKTYDKACNI